MQPQQIHSKPPPLPPPPVPVPVSQPQNHEASKSIIPSSTTTQNVNLVNLLKQNTVPVSILK